jgi:hypothetical protein
MRSGEVYVSDINEKLLWSGISMNAIVVRLVELVES